MLRSMFSGVSGLKAHQTKMDVIGNNIANVNTTAYKSGSVTFQEVFSQLVSNASKPAEGGLGGTNPQQVGLGVEVGSISNKFEQGSIQRTSNPFDFAIDGDGFFVVSDGSGNQYTRAGNFAVDVEGNLVNSGGARVQGWNYDLTTGEVDTTKPLEGINLSDISIPAVATSELKISGNLDSGMMPHKITEEVTIDGQECTLEMRRADNDDDGTPNLVKLTLTATADDGTEQTTTGTFNIDADGNIDGDITIGTNDIGLDTDAAIDVIKKIDTSELRSETTDYNINIYDSLGNDHVLTFTMEKTSANKFNYTVSFGGSLLKDDAGDSIGGSFEFNSDGTLYTGSVEKDAIVIPEDLIGNGADALSIAAEDITFAESLFTQYANDTQLSMEQNGNAAGEMISYTFDQSGQAVGTFSNGAQLHIATIAVASFDNNNGLEKVGDSQYVSTWNSGEPVVGVAGTGDRGSVATLSLEMSNVDLSNEFTEMIVAQRGFQANSRIITTSDSILEELVNLKR